MTSNVLFYGVEPPDGEWQSNPNVIPVVMEPSDKPSDVIVRTSELSPSRFSMWDLCGTVSNASLIVLSNNGPQHHLAFIAGVAYSSSIPVILHAEDADDAIDVVMAVGIPSTLGLSRDRETLAWCLDRLVPHLESASKSYTEGIIAVQTRLGFYDAVKTLQDRTQEEG